MLQNRSQDLAIFFQAEEKSRTFSVAFTICSGVSTIVFLGFRHPNPSIIFLSRKLFEKAVLLHLHGMLKIQVPAYPHPANQKTAQACHRLLPATQFHRKSSFHGIHALPPVHFHVYGALQIQEQATHLQI